MVITADLKCMRPTGAVKAFRFVGLARTKQKVRSVVVVVVVASRHRPVRYLLGYSILAGRAIVPAGEVVDVDNVEAAGERAMVVNLVLNYIVVEFGPVA